MSLKSFVIPEGCRASVVEDSTRLPSNQLRKEALIVCGSRSNTVSDTHTVGSERSDLASKATEVITAMCLGCEFNTSITEIS